MEMKKPVLARRTTAAIMLGACMCIWWYGNPIGLHRKVQVAGVTVAVPFGWVMRTTASRADTIESVILRRVSVPFIPWITVSIVEEMPGGHTISSARREQIAMYQDAAYYSKQRVFDLNSGKYQSLCAQATLRSGALVLSCAVVGTPLRFDFMGSKAVDGDAEKMLASLT